MVDAGLVAAQLRISLCHQNIRRAVLNANSAHWSPNLSVASAAYRAALLFLSFRRGQSRVPETVHTTSEEGGSFP
jgi:hypothetical protein